MLLRLIRSQTSVTTWYEKPTEGAETQQVGKFVNCRITVIFQDQQQRHGGQIQKFNGDFGGVKSSCTVAALGTFQQAIVRHGACHIEAQAGPVDTHNQSALLQLACTSRSPGLKM